jgi:chemosensory pili system protein ChpA (sensor histidine kinase/response regulator)
MHTIKGAANMTGFPVVGRVGGALEGLLDLYLDHERPVDRATLEVIIVARRCLAGMVRGLDDLSPFEHPVSVIEQRCLRLRTALLAAVAPPATTPKFVDANDHVATVESGVGVDPLDEPVTNHLTESSTVDDEPVVDQPEVEVDTPRDDLSAASTAEETDNTDVDIYELAAEIASMARVQSSLRPHNAAIMPDDNGALTDHINALTAEVEPPGTDELVASQPTPDLAPEVPEQMERADDDDVEALHTDDTSSFDAGDETLVPIGPSELGSALLDLALGSGAVAALAGQPRLPARSTVPDINEAAIEREMHATFRDEAGDLIDALTRTALAIERDPEAPEPRQELFRVLHTLKGAAAAAGFDDLSERCHHFEDHIAAEDAGPSLVTGLFDLVREIERQTVDRRATDLAADATATEAELDNPAGVRVRIERLDGLLDLVGEMVVNRSTFDQRLLRLGSTIDELALTAERLRRSSQILEQDGFDARTLRLLGPAHTAGDERTGEFDALELDRYTEIERLARELAEVASDITAATGELGHLRSDFDSVSARQRRLTTAMQDDLMRVRMVPASSLVPRLYRVVRAVAAERARDIDFAVEGGETPFDTALLDALSDSLAHLLRNAVDHGIEPAEERLRVGKPDRGVVRLRAWRDGNEAVLEVTDDGRGIDHHAVVERARMRGYLVSDNPSRAEALQLILLPGFSTRDTADEVSGRGVGLDVVNAAVQRLKGRVVIDSALGSGTTIRLRMPVMLAVSQAFLVSAAGQRFAIPVGNVEFVAQRRGARLRRFGDAAVIEFNDATLPLFDLGERLRGASTDALDREDGWLLVVRVGEERWAVRVDGLDGQQEIVVKPLGRFLKHARGVIGGTVLGNGEIALIVDVPSIASQRTARTTPALDTVPPIEHVEDIETPRQRVALVVDDSLSVRKVLGRTLNRHGWATLEARDGVEALDRLDFERVDVIVTDIEMPRMDGFELTTATRRHRDHRQIPIVVLTSRAGDKHRGKALDLGANAYLVKPFQEQELIATIDALAKAAGRVM